MNIHKTSVEAIAWLKQSETGQSVLSRLETLLTEGAMDLDGLGKDALMRVLEDSLYGRKCGATLDLVREAVG